MGENSPNLVTVSITEKHKIEIYVNARPSSMNGPLAHFYFSQAATERHISRLLIVKSVGLGRARARALGSGSGFAKLTIPRAQPGLGISLSP
jgi:hypothetical protein